MLTCNELLIKAHAITKKQSKSQKQVQFWVTVSKETGEPSTILLKNVQNQTKMHFWVTASKETGEPSTILLENTQNR